MTDTSTLPPEPFHLARGNHSSLSKGGCYNELAAVLAGEPFSDSPACVSPVIRRMGMTLNDRLDDERRQLLRPFVLRSLGTAGDGRDEERRLMCTEWLLHRVLPDLLDKADLQEAAQKLRDLQGDLEAEGVLRAIQEARDEAREARTAAMIALRARIREKIREPAAVAEAEAVAAAAVAAVAEAATGAAAEAGAVAAAAVAAATVAVAEAVAAAAVVAEAAAATGAAAEAGAVAAAEAGAVAAAAAVAEVATVAAADFSYGSKGYWAVRKAVRVKVEEIVRPQFDELLAGSLDLMDRLLPESPIMLPVVGMELARIVTAAPSEVEHA